MTTLIFIMVTTAHGHYSIGSSLSFIICWKLSPSFLSSVNTVAVSAHPSHWPNQCMIIWQPLNMVISIIDYPFHWPYHLLYLQMRHCHPSSLICNPYSWLPLSLAIPRHGYHFHCPPLHMVIPIIGHPCTWPNLSLATPALA